MHLRTIQCAFAVHSVVRIRPLYSVRAHTHTPLHMSTNTYGGLRFVGSS